MKTIIDQIKKELPELLNNESYEIDEFGSIVIEKDDVKLTITNSAVLDKVWIGITTSLDDAELVKLCRGIKADANYQKQVRIAQLEKELSELKK